MPAAEELAEKLFRSLRASAVRSPDDIRTGESPDPLRSGRPDLAPS